MRSGPDQLGGSLAGKLSSSASSTIASGGCSLDSCWSPGRASCLRPVFADLPLAGRWRVTDRRAIVVEPSDATFKNGHPLFCETAHPRVDGHQFADAIDQQARTATLRHKC
jgi:hypothetical protein